MVWVPLLQFPIEWAALALLVMACLYWERSGFSGLGAEGCVAAAMLGILLGYEWTGDYLLSCLVAAGAAAAFAVVSGKLVRLFRADPAGGSFAPSPVPASALGLFARAGGPPLFPESPPPGLTRGT